MSIPLFPGIAGNCINTAALVKDIEVSRTDYIQRDKLFTGFSGWQDGYCAFTHNFNEKNRLIEYMKNQEELHKAKSFREEFIVLLNPGFHLGLSRMHSLQRYKNFT
jgi:hypothetical protein